MIDAHHHFLDPTQRSYPWITATEAAIDRPWSPAELKPSLDEHGVTRTVLVQTVATTEETLDMLHAAVEHEWVAGVVGWVDLTRGDVPDQLAKLRAAPGGHRLVGIRHSLADEPSSRWVLQPDVLRGLQQVADASLVFDLEITSRELPAARAAVARLPTVQFVLDHAAKPPIASRQLRNWMLETELLSHSSNVACKLSGLVTEAEWQSWSLADLQPVADHVLRWFGPSRVMFGSDWPVCELAADYSSVLQAARRLAGPHWQEISERTAERIYGLEPVMPPSAVSEETAVTPS